MHSRHNDRQYECDCGIINQTVNDGVAHSIGMSNSVIDGLVYYSTVVQYLDIRSSCLTLILEGEYNNGAS